jgi:recombinational DNA repair ATPase RecF
LYGLYRSKYVEYIQDSLRDFPSFFSKYNFEFRYESSVEGYSTGPSQTYSQMVRDSLSKNQERDILTGHTHIGPHRDDWGFFVLSDGFPDAIPAQEYLSRGEMKMILLGFKMIEADFINKTTNLPTIILIDDIFAELDDKNSEIFLNSLTTHQVILTSQKSLPNHEKHHDFICINLEDS